MNKIVLVVFIFCVCQGIDAFCARRCGEPMTRSGCETCMSCPMKECDTCRDTTPCSMCMNNCKCNSYLDSECECLKSMVRFPDVEYPMSIAEMKPYYSGCGRCL